MKTNAGAYESSKTFKVLTFESKHCALNVKKVSSLSEENTDVDVPAMAGTTPGGGAVRRAENCRLKIAVVERGPRRRRRRSDTEDK